MASSTLFENRFSIKVMEWLVYAVVFSLPLVRAHWNAKLILLLMVVWLISIPIFEIWKQIKGNKIVWLFISLFILDVIGLLHSENVLFGLKYLESKFTVLLFPILLVSSSNRFSEDFIDNLFKVFIAAIFILLFYFVALLASGYSEFTLTYYIMNRLTDIPIVRDQTLIKIHASYLSLYISICIFYLIEKIVSAKFDKLNVVFSGITLAVLFFFLVWLNSRASLIGFGLAIVFYVFYRLSKKQVLIAILTLFILLSIIFLTPFTKERLVDAPLRAIKGGTVVDAEDPATWPISFRFQIIQCNVELLNNGRWITGYGTGDYRDQLRQCFNKHEFLWLIARDFDAHSEYFAQLHRHGILGLILFLCCIFIPFYLALKRKNILFMVFAILIAVSAAPETILTVQRGVVFYALFNAVLFINPGIPDCKKTQFCKQ